MKEIFLPGDVVQIRQDIPNKPTMLVVKKEMSLLTNSQNESTLKGIRCRWFTTDGHMEEAIFNTKDLIKID